MFVLFFSSTSMLSRFIALIYTSFVPKWLHIIEKRCKCILFCSAVSSNQKTHLMKIWILWTSASQNRVDTISIGRKCFNQFILSHFFSAFVWNFEKCILNVIDKWWEKNTDQLVHHGVSLCVSICFCFLGFYISLALCAF